MHRSCRAQPAPWDRQPGRVYNLFDFSTIFNAIAAVHYGCGPPTIGFYGWWAQRELVVIILSSSAGTYSRCCLSVRPSSALESVRVPLHLHSMGGFTSTAGAARSGVTAAYNGRQIPLSATLAAAAFNVSAPLPPYISLSLSQSLSVFALHCVESGWLFDSNGLINAISKLSWRREFNWVSATLVCRIYQL